ncbi:hypothetical protein [Rhodococcus opacus]|uniref:hypothetical protein n=1 Tax=Rhodococcus opacus TaxID=37919 RepID=UPI001C48C442|nr:hypothetical protein [Rhodococcus opacus]MBV6760226.1 hypothetical protein [Rhodococcus opacus]
MSNSTSPAADVVGRFIPARSGDRKVVVLDSATHSHRHASTPESAPGADVIVNASYAGVYCAHLLEEAKPLATIGLDCGIGKDGAGIAGLWYFEGQGIPAAAADISNLEHGNGADLYDNGVISRVNGYAEALGVTPGLSVAAAAKILLDAVPRTEPLDYMNREIVDVGDNGHHVVCTNSIADALPEDRDTNVLCTAGHTGRSVVEYILGFRPYGFICSDGAMGRDGSGISALEPANAAGIAGAAVSADSARMGDGHSTYYDGIISARNELAAAAGVAVGQPATEAARLLARR